MSNKVCAKLEMEPKNLDRRKKVETFLDISGTNFGKTWIL